MRGRRMSINSVVSRDIKEFSESFDPAAQAVGVDMAGHDIFLLGPKVVLLDSFVVDLLDVDTTAQTFRLKLLLNMDWEDDGTIEAEVKAKRGLGRHKYTAAAKSNAGRSNRLDSSVSGEYYDDFSSCRGLSREGSDHKNKERGGDATYKTGKYVLRPEFIDDPISTTWSPQMVLVNAIEFDEPVEAGSKFHSVQTIANRPVITSSVMYQPECRCEFTFENFPFDETDLVIKFSSNRWNSEQVVFKWSDRISQGRESDDADDNYGANGRNSLGYFGDYASIDGGRRSTDSGNRFTLSRASVLQKFVDSSAIGGVGLSEFEITEIRVSTTLKDVNSMQRYDNAEGAFSQANLILRVRRDPYSYLLRVASVAELLMFLEVLSFFTVNEGLSDRFAVSGTNFLAMVSLYEPMSEAMPKLSVVTRVDKWHLYNFVLLFASNLENLLAYFITPFTGTKLMYNIEVLMGIGYLYLVVCNLIWFLKPLKEREEFDVFLDWVEDTVEKWSGKWIWKLMDVLRKVIGFVSHFFKTLMSDDDDSNAEEAPSRASASENKESTKTVAAGGVKWKET